MKLFLLLICISVFLSISCTKRNSLQDKFPNKLLSNDYGILSEQDLVDKRDVLPLDSLGIHSNPAPRWICFESENLISKCIKSEEKVEELNNYASDFEMTINEAGKQYEYFFRSLISYEGCEEHRTKWKKLIEGEKYFCISGSMMSVENKTKITGAFHKFKTKKGCDAWFYKDCK